MRVSGTLNQYAKPLELGISTHFEKVIDTRHDCSSIAEMFRRGTLVNLPSSCPNLQYHIPPQDRRGATTEALTTRKGMIARAKSSSLPRAPKILATSKLHLP